MSQQREPTCPDCGKSMEVGFVVDHTRNAMSSQTWVQGPPQRSFWFGLATKGRRTMSVETWRCSKCGRLMSFAKEQTTLSRFR